MVCDRCIRSVKKIFEANGITPVKVKLGEVEIKSTLSPVDLITIDSALTAEGFELVDSSAPVLVTKIKAALVSLFGQNEISEDFKLSTFLTAKFPYDYSHLSRVFSNHEKDTIEHYLIRLRIEKAKELLTYKDNNVSQVAYNLGYASAAHFSRQFKKMVGIPPSVFQNDPTDRKSLENI